MRTCGEAERMIRNDDKPRLRQIIWDVPQHFQHDFFSVAVALSSMHLWCYAGIVIVDERQVERLSPPTRSIETAAE